MTNIAQVIRTNSSLIVSLPVPWILDIWKNALLEKAETFYTVVDSVGGGRRPSGGGGGAPI